MDAPLDVRTQAVIFKMTSNLGFISPIITMPVLAAKQAQFATAISNALNGGKEATAIKNEKREELLGLLRQEAAYVQSIAGENLPLLLSSGFEAMSTNRAQVQLVPPVIEHLDNPMSQQLGLRLKPVYTAKAYEVRISYGTSGWQAVGVFTQSRLVIPDLTPGTTYTVQARAIGGLTGYSDWSDPVSHMAM